MLELVFEAMTGFMQEGVIYFSIPFGMTILVTYCYVILKQEMIIFLEELLQWFWYAARFGNPLL